jgi:glycerol-3-phosphate dehydrogenase
VPHISSTPTVPALGRADDRPVGVGVELTAAEVAYFVQHEHATRLADLIMRRTAAAITGTIDTGLIEAIADAAAGELGWSDARRRAEIEELVTDLEGFHDVGHDVLDRRTKERTVECA